MLYKLLCDMLDILRLRYQSTDHYRYSPLVILVVLLLLGLINAAGSSIIFGNEPGAIAYAIVFTVLKIVLLARVMGKTLHYYGALKLNWFGFVLASEALIIPQLAFMYIPALATFALVWQTWAFVVQLIGFTRMSGRSGWQVLIGLIIYAIVLGVIGSLITALFLSAGWLDATLLQQQLDTLLQSTGTQP